MPFVIGSFTRDADDDYSVSVDFSTADVFDATPVTTATATATGLTVGTPSVAANVVTFRVSGGTAGTDTVITVRATNNAATPAVLERHLRCSTV